MVTVRSIIALAAMNQWPLFQMDVYNAFLQGDPEEEVYMSAKGILLCQSKYDLELIAKLGLSGAKPAITPMEQNKRLTTVEYDEHCHLDNDPTLADVKIYQRLIRKLLYLTLTRPDIAYSVQTLSQFMQAPKQSHLEAAYRVVRYAKNEPGFGILISTDRDMTLSAHCNADGASCPNSKESVTGYLVKFGGSLISWKSKKQAVVARSSAESEYRSMALTVSELIWLVGMFRE
ncbi:secreted RxLR effector protein 161-like [Nicotiana tabacum]|uniref:Secreted RxLR effector protein 161-like n=1 Tax=Nicotiana tabacum TaxID=4097 RepID=A0AC58SUH0_TOBAC